MAPLNGARGIGEAAGSRAGEKGKKKRRDASILGVLGPCCEDREKNRQLNNCLGNSSWIRR